VLLLWAATTAQAQFDNNLNLMWSPGLDPQTTQMMSQLRQNQAWAESVYGRRGKTIADGRPAMSALAAVTYARDPEVSRRVKDSVLARWKQSNPGKDAALEQVFARYDFPAEFRQITASFGIDPGNLADVAAAYLVASWALFHKVNTIDKAAVVAARDQLRGALSSNDAIRKLSPAQKQIMAETMMYQTVLLQANRLQVAQRNDASVWRGAAEQARRSLLETGIDLEKLRLTQQGLVSERN